MYKLFCKFYDNLYEYTFLNVNFSIAEKVSGTFLKRKCESWVVVALKSVKEFFFFKIIVKYM